MCTLKREQAAATPPLRPPKCRHIQTQTQMQSARLFVYINFFFLHSFQIKRADMDISPDSESPVEHARSMETMHDTPILNVTLVMPGSPADQCGIRIDDEILEFGSINQSNFKELKQISELVTHRQNQPIPLKVKRHGRIHDITLVPKVWSGRGLLGCNIVIPNPSQQ